MEDKCPACGTFRTGAYSFDDEGQPRLVGLECDCVENSMANSTDNDSTVVRKITHGFVCQTYDLETGKCVSQEFHAGDECEWECGPGGTDNVDIDEPENAIYQPYDMVPPDISMGKIAEMLDDYAELLRISIAVKDIEIASQRQDLESLNRSIKNA